MFSLQNMTSGLRSLFQKKEVEQELDEELRTYLEMATEEKMKQGMSRDDAVRAVRLDRGSLGVAKETVRAAGWESLVETCWQDLRFGLRMLRKNPGFTAVAVLTLALGIGANTAIFSVVYAVLLKPLPCSKSEELFNVFQQQAQDETVQTGWSYPNFQELREQNHVFSAVAGAQRHQLTVTGRGEPIGSEYRGRNRRFLFTLRGETSRRANFLPGRRQIRRAARGRPWRKSLARAAGS